MKSIYGKAALNGALLKSLRIVSGDFIACLMHSFYELT
jgi:hypothetical protein